MIASLPGPPQGLSAFDGRRGAGPSPIS
jgi:hypothetical protein